MASIKTVLYTSKTYKDGKHPLVLQIIHNRKIRKIALGHNLFPQEWDAAAQKVVKGVPNGMNINRLIVKKLAEANDALIELEYERSEGFHIDELIERVSGRRQPPSFTKYAKSQIERMKKAGRRGNALSYETALNVFSKYLKKEDILFNDITYKTLVAFRENHLQKGYTINGHNVYTRAIRAIYNKAKAEKVIRGLKNPFEGYSIKNTKTKKRAISKEDMIKIYEVELPPNSDLWHARNIFMFSFHTIGMSYVDIANLKLSNLVDGRIRYTRAKTKKEYSIAINNEIKSIIDYYIEDKEKDDFIFPIVLREDKEEQYKDIRNSLKLYNKRLREIGELAGVDEHLTSYVSRHSWASIANFSNVPIGIIAQGLGHDDIKTTQTYLADFENTEIDTANTNLLMNEENDGKD